jgi:chromosome segregation ATPase
VKVASTWYVKKSGGEVLGPVDAGELKRWADDGRVASDDAVSPDGTAWTPAPELPELEAALRGRAQAPAPAVESGIHFKDLAMRNDSLQREVAKWTKMYEDLRENHVTVERALRQRIEDSRRSEAAARDEIRDLRRRVERSELDYRNLINATQGAEGEEGAADPDRARLMAMVEANAELSRSLDTLFAQLQEKGEAITAMARARAEAEQRAEEDIRRMEARVKEEQAIAARAVARHTELEEAHQQLVRAYRNMNDRFIRLHQQVEAASSSGGAKRNGDAPPRISLNR